MSASDSDLLEAWSAREDANAFRELTARYAALVYRVSLNILRDPVEAEDVAQESFLALAVVGRRPGAYLAPWLHRVAANLSLRRLRDGKRRRERETRFAEQQRASATTQFDETSALIHDAINTLPDDLRVPLVTHYFGGATHAVIAAQLGLSRSAVSLRIDRGVKQIRVVLRKRGAQASAAAIVASLGASAHAVPTTLAARLGEIALVGPKGIDSGSASEALALAEHVPASSATALAVAVPTGVVAGAVALLLLAGGAWKSLQGGGGALAARAPDAVKVVSAPVVVALPAATPEVDATQDEATVVDAYTVPGAGRVTGVVLDPAGHPVAEAALVLTSGYDGVRSVAGDAGRYTAHGISGADGRFSFEGLPLWRAVDVTNGMENTRIEATARGTNGSSGAWISSLSHEGYVEIILKQVIAGNTITGRIAGPDGSPPLILEIRVELGRSWVDLNNITQGAAPEVHADGTFVCAGLVPGTYLFGVQAKGLPTHTFGPVVAGTRDVVFSMSAGATAKITLIDAATGTPMNDFKPYLEPCQGKLLSWQRGETMPEGPAQAGTFTFQGLRPLRYRVVVGGGAWVPVAEDLYVEIADTTPHAFTVRLLPGENFVAGLGVTERSEAIVPLTPKGLPASPPLEMMRTSEPESDAPSTVIHGEARTASGAPALAAAILAWSPAAEDRGQGRQGLVFEGYTGEDGTFSATLRGRGPFHVQAIHGEGISPCIGPVDLAALSAEPLSLVLVPAGRVAGRLVDHRGQGLSRVVVTAKSQSPDGGTILPMPDRMSSMFMTVSADGIPSQAMFRTGASGAFVLTPLLPGNYTLHAEVSVPEGEPYIVEQSLNLPEGASVGPLSLRLGLDEGGALLEGRVTILGEPAPGMRISLDGRDAQYTGPRGEYRFLRLASGAHSLSVFCDLESMVSRYNVDREIMVEENTSQTFDIELGSGSCVVEGVFTLNGSVYPKRSVEFWPEEEESTHDTVKVWTDDAGHYRAEGLYAMEYAVKLDTIGPEPWHYLGPAKTLGAPLSEGETLQHDIALASGMVDVVCVGAGASVRLVKAASGMGRSGGRMVSEFPTARNAGRSRFLDLPAGEYQAQLALRSADGTESVVQSVGFSVGLASVTVIDADLDTHTLSIRAEAAQ